jgi:hypothetical protein
LRRTERKEVAFTSTKLNRVMDAPLELGAVANLPYVFDAFDYRGFLEAADGTPNLLTTPEAREDELPWPSPS